MQLNHRTDELLKSSNEPGDPVIYAKIAQEERDALGLFNRWDAFMPELVTKR